MPIASAYAPSAIPEIKPVDEARNRRVQKIARAISIKRGVDPDRQAYAGVPERLTANSGWYYAPSDAYSWPAWRAFIADAEAALEVIEDEAATMLADSGGLESNPPGSKTVVLTDAGSR